MESHPNSTGFDASSSYAIDGRSRCEPAMVSVRPPTWWIIIAIFGVVLTGLSSVALSMLDVGGETSRFVLSSWGVLLVCLGIVLWSAVRVDEPLGRQPSTASIVTFVRLLALALLGGWILTGAMNHLTWVPVGLFAIAAGLDALDGAVARLDGNVTARGKHLDMHTDALTILLGSVVVIGIGRAPIAFIVVGVAQYAFLGGTVGRRLLGREVAKLPASPIRRLLGATLMGAIWVAMWPPLDPSFGYVLTIGVGALVLINYTRDWLAISGYQIGYEIG